MSSLSEELAKLANPTPILKDPENDSDDETVARIVSHADDGLEDIEDGVPSRLRQQTAILLSDSDKKYAGKRVSRKKFEDISENSLHDAAESDDDQDDDSDDDNDDGGGGDVQSDEEEMDIADFQAKLELKSDEQGFSFEDDGDYGKYADDEDDDEDDEDGKGEEDEASDDINESLEDRDPSGDDDDDDDDAADDDDDEEITSDEEVGGIQQFSAPATDDVTKGKAAKQQLALWDTLLEGRIKLQKSASLMNQLPQHDTWAGFTKSSTAFADEATKAQQALKHLLDSLVHLQDLLCLQNEETSYIVEGQGHDKSSQKNKAPVDPDDEEIPSDTDEEAIDTEGSKVIEGSKVTVDMGDKPRKRKFKSEDYPEFLSERHSKFKKFRDATIQRWHDKTKLAGGKVKGKSFNAFEQSVNAQINRILSDKDRLIKRSQLKRSVYRVLGTAVKQDDPEVLPDDNPEERLIDHDHLKDYDREIFDDSDFYHQLLRELIEKKTADMSDPVAISRQWLEIQKLRGKNKKKVDKKASKGRKVRYDIHKKLVNFMAVKDDCEWSHEARDDLFKSLFGKRFTSGVV